MMIETDLDNSTSLFELFAEDEGVPDVESSSDFLCDGSSFISDAVQHDEIECSESNDNHHSECVFKAQLLEEKEGITSTIKNDTEMKQQTSKSWSHREDFFADSPYFHACVEKEMHSDRIFAEIVKDLSEDVKVLSKAGIKMAYATRCLSASCQYWGQGNANEEESEEAAEIKRKVLGARICSLFEGLGKSLEEVAIAQEKMCTIIEETLGSTVVEEAADDFNTTERLKSEARSKTNTAEQELSKYLNPPSGGRSLVRMGSSRSMNSSRTELDGSCHNVQDTKDYLRQINVSQAGAELSRFKLIQHLVKAQDERKLKLCQKVGKIAFSMQNSLQKCTNVLGVLGPHAEQTEKELIEAYARYSNRWQERSKLLNSTLDNIETVPFDNSDNSLNHDITTESNHSWQSLQKKSPEVVEREIKFWDMPNILAASARYRRPRAGCVRLEGWLYKKGSSFMIGEAWERQWFMVSDGALHIVHPSSNETELFTKEKVCDIVLCTVRELDSSSSHDKGKSSNKRFSFQLVSANEKQPLTLKARGPNEFKFWVDGIRSYIEEQLIKGDPHSDHLNSCIGKDYLVRSAEVFNTIIESSIRDDTEAFDLDASIRDYAGERLGTSTTTTDSCNPLVKQVMKANTFCAECSKANPDWVSLNLGILVCLNCSGVHRSLGVHVSKVRSLSLDALTELEARLFLTLGNERMNQVWEEACNNLSALEEGKPHPQSDQKEREKWIIDKYVTKKFLCERPVDNTFCQNENLFIAAKKGDVFGIARSIAHGADVNWKKKEEGCTTALQVCLARLQHIGTSESSEDPCQYPECVELLLQNGSTYGLPDGKLVKDQSQSCADDATEDLQSQTTNKSNHRRFRGTSCIAQGA